MPGSPLSNTSWVRRSNSFGCPTSATGESCGSRCHGAQALRDDESPEKLTELVASTWAVSAKGGFEPLPPGLRAWLARMLQLDPHNAFPSAIEARGELDGVIGEHDFIA